MFDKLSDNINLLMNEVHISAEELARQTGIPASTIKKIRNRYSPNPTLTTLIPLAQFFSVSLSQLIGDEPLPDTRIKGLYKPNRDKLHHFPILSWEQSINLSTANSEPHSSISTEHAYNPATFCLIVEENDWENISKGTAILIDPSLIAEHRDFILVYREGQSIPTLKQAIFDEGTLYLKSVIFGHNNIAAFTPEHKILGVVVEYKKQLKKVISN